MLKTFVSSETNGPIGRDREFIAKELRQGGHNVSIQEEFAPHGRCTLNGLRREIQLNCDQMIQIQEDNLGSSPTNDDVKSVLSEIVKEGREFLDNQPHNLLNSYGGLTYVEWEALFALHYEKPLFVFQNACSPQGSKVLVHTSRLRCANPVKYPIKFRGLEGFLAEAQKVLSRQERLESLKNHYTSKNVSIVAHDYSNEEMDVKRSVATELKEKLTGKHGKSPDFSMSWTFDSTRPPTDFFQKALGCFEMNQKLSGIDAGSYGSLLVDRLRKKDSLFLMDQFEVILDVESMMDFFGEFSESCSGLIVVNSAIPITRIHNITRARRERALPPDFRRERYLAY